MAGSTQSAPSRAAEYAQLRRDKETEAREALRKLLPQSVFTPELESRGELNLTAKVLVAAQSYIAAEQERKLDGDDRHTHPLRTTSISKKIKVGFRTKPQHSKRRVDEKMNKLTQINHYSTPRNAIQVKTVREEPIEEVRQLRQVANRLVQKAEEMLVVRSDPSKESLAVLDQAGDLMIDMIALIEKHITAAKTDAKLNEVTHDMSDLPACENDGQGVASHTIISDDGVRSSIRCTRARRVSGEAEIEEVVREIHPTTGWVYTTAFF